MHSAKGMYDVDAIESINFEQLATVTDRLLLRGGRPSKRRLSTARIGPSLDTLERTVCVRVQQRPPIDLHVVLGSAIVTVLVFIAILA